VPLTTKGRRGHCPRSSPSNLSAGEAMAMRDVLFKELPEKETGVEDNEGM
jgi:hypothetical protein